MGRMNVVARLIGAMLFAAGAREALAQARPGAVSVKVTGAAVPDSQPLHILVVATSLESGAKAPWMDSTDARRPLVLSELPAGRYRVETRVIGFIPDTAVVQVGAGKTTDVHVDLRQVAALAGVSVMGTGQGHLAAFERRRATGKGTFLTRDDLVKSGQNQVSEVLRRVRGVRIECASDCTVQMARSADCKPRFYANGFPTDASILHTPLLDVAGVEIYRGPSETPGEFLSAQSMCGVIVIWMK